MRNYRVAVDQTLIELPAGTLEPGEDPAETAVRELAEETGYRAGRIEHLLTFCMSPGILDEQMHLYLAEQLQPGPMALGGRRRHPAAAVHVGRIAGDGPAGRNPRRQDVGRAAVLPHVCGYIPIVRSPLTNGVPKAACLAAKRADCGESHQQDHRQHHGIFDRGCRFFVSEKSGNESSCVSNAALSRCDKQPS